MRTMAYGVMTITTQPGLSLSAGQPMTVRKDRLHWLYGPVVSYNGLTGELVLDVQHLRGAGTYAGWVLGAAGLPGPAGPSNALQIGTVTTGTHGAPADATITGAPPLQQLNLVLPPGADGDVTPELEALYDDTVTAANVAGAAATAAGNSATAAGTSAGQATTAKVAAQAAQGAAETARTAAETAATASATSATQASTAKTGAETARTGAETARTGAESAATAAASSATQATASKVAAQAAQGAAEGARDVAQAYAAAAKRVALYFAFDSAVTDADPGAGHWRLNNVFPASATWLYIDLLASNGGDVTAWIDSWAASTNAVKGDLTLVDAADAGVWLKLQVTGVTVATGYRKVAVAYVGHAGTLLAGHDFSAQFVGYGNKGADGLGNVASVGATAPLQSTGGANPVISIDPASPTAPGSLSAADKAKLDGVATGATANSADAALRDRATHTGTQLAATISDFLGSVRSTALTGLSTATNAVITAADTVLSGLGKLQKQITDLTTTVSGKIDSTYLDTDVALAANSDTKIATQKAVKAYADGLIAANDAMVFKGVIDCSANPNYPAGNRGDTYRVSVAGKIGGASGTNVEAGDLLLCLTDGTASGTQAAVGANWTVVQTNLDGAVIGPASVTDGNLAAFNGATGKLIKQLTAAEVRTLLSLVVGTNVQAYDANTAKLNAAQSWTAEQTFKELKDTVFTITDAAAFEIDPGNGSVQVVTLGANRTPAATNFEAGQTVLLGIDDGTARTITWTTVNPTWVKPGGTASAPTLATTGYTWVLLWKVGSTVYGAEVGKP